MQEVQRGKRHKIHLNITYKRKKEQQIKQTTKETNPGVNKLKTQCTSHKGISH